MDVRAPRLSRTRRSAAAIAATAAAGALAMGAGTGMVGTTAAHAAAPTAAAPTSVAKPAAPTAPTAPMPTPPMGFNDWNAFHCNVDEQLIKQTADFFVSSGLKKAGYTYVNIDDCWLEKTRSATGHLVPDPTKFPDGIKGVADYVHSKGLKLGIYNSAGDKTCAGYPGSLGHEQTDADDYAAWGVDYLKYDNCGDHGSYPDTAAGYTARYKAMGDALKKSGRKIAYSLCEWGNEDPWLWGSQTGGQLWRTTGDISDNWASLKSIIEQNSVLAPYAHPGAFNDPDMLEVGNGGMTDTEYKTHFSLWAEMAAPLLIGTDLRKATPETMAIYENSDVIAVDQDKLGIQAGVIDAGSDWKVFSKPLSNGDRAVALYNSSDAAQTVSTTAARTGLPKATAYTAKDLWSKKTYETAGTLSAFVPAHGTVMMRVSKAKAGWNAKAPLAQLAVSASGATSYGVAVTPGGSAKVTTAVSDFGRAPLVDVRVTASAPDGWTLKPGSATRNRIGTNQTFSRAWTLTAPSDAAAGTYALPVTTTYRWGGRHVAVQQATLGVRVAQPPSAGTHQLSDLTWISATNGWGPVEKDTSNGEDKAGDGKTITINGKTYKKGLGTNAESDIVYFLGGHCSGLTTDVGIDDEKDGSDADASFQIYADDNQVADSGSMTAADPAKTLTASLTGATWLRLHVDPDGTEDSDHADWAGPVLTCS